MAVPREQPPSPADAPPVPGAVHLRPCAEIAADALLPGDPGRALALAQEILDEPRMSNHHRGLWGYTGTSPDGRPVTIQSTGIGGPSAVVVLTELARLGVRRAIRIGTCASIDGALAEGDALIAASALPQDGASAALGATGLLHAHGPLTSSLRAAASGAVTAAIATSDLFYEPQGGSALDRDRRARGAVAVDLCTAPLLALAERLGLQLACGLVVAETRDGRGGPRSRLADRPLAAASARLALAARDALAAVAAPDG